MISKVYGKRQVESPHVLICLIRFGCDLKQLGHVLSFTIELGYARLDLPLIAFAICIGGNTSDLHQVHFGKIIGVHT